MNCALCCFLFTPTSHVLWTGQPLAYPAVQKSEAAANRTIGQPNKITVIFGRKVTKQHRGKLQTAIEDMDLPNPVIRSHYRNGFIKQYVRDHLCLRTEPATNNVTDYGVNKAIEHLPAVREKMAAVIDNYLDVQQVSWKRLSIAGNFNISPSPPSPRPANAFPASSLTTPDNWP